MSFLIVILKSICYVFFNNINNTLLITTRTHRFSQRYYFCWWASDSKLWRELYCGIQRCRGARHGANVGEERGREGREGGRGGRGGRGGSEGAREGGRKGAGGAT